MSLKAALGTFFNEFDKFETVGVRAALHSLSGNAEFADQSTSLLDLDARLLLAKRIAVARGAADDVTAQLDHVVSRARKLCDVRKQIERIPTDLRAGGIEASLAHRHGRPGDYRHPVRDGRTRTHVRWIPDSAQLVQRAEEAAELRELLQAITDKVDDGAAGGSEPR